VKRLGIRAAGNILGVLLVLPPLPIAAADPDLYSQIASLWKSLANAGKLNGAVQRIAVANFTEAQGNVTGLGVFVAEELIGCIADAGALQVVERRRLKNVLEEKKLQETGLLEAKNLSEVGGILGVQAVLTGSISRLQGRYIFRGRILSVETGKNLAIASVDVGDRDPLVAGVQGVRVGEDSAPDGFRHPDLRGWVRESRGGLLRAALVLLSAGYARNPEVRGQRSDVRSQEEFSRGKSMLNSPAYPERWGGCLVLAEPEGFLIS
jgi:TolB-like protein